MFALVSAPQKSCRKDDAAGQDKDFCRYENDALVTRQRRAMIFERCL
jgi:hypothetical protein